MTTFGISIGEGDHRNWDDFRRYGFVSGGQGRWYSRTLKALSVGDHVYAYIPKVGFVGSGVVTAEATPVRDFVVEVGGRTVPILEVPLRQPGLAENADDLELCEYCVGVRWIDTRDRDDAYSEPGLRRNQNTAFRLTHEPTLHALEDEFEGAPPR